MFSALKPDNLQVVEGIGPKMDEVLKKHGVHTWAELGASDFPKLRALLDKENPTRYRIIDPKTWPDQAKLADKGDWDKLIAMQKGLNAGREGISDHETDSKVEKMLIKLGVLRRWKQDDLKAVEGIGPKIESLLKAGGIDTWQKLADAQIPAIQAILNKAGSRYKLADPGTWPQQSKLCADGKWDELTELQDRLDGGK
jgi:predicted flap endonuclease-1-like 5' DNA nuclease